MTYSPECVEAFEDWAAPNGYSLERVDTKTGWKYLCVDTDCAIPAFAANWERVRELEEALAALQQSAERAIFGSHGNAFLPRQLEDYNKANAEARKLLEAE